MVSMDRMLKILTTHSGAVDSLEKKLNEIEAVKKSKRGGSDSGGGSQKMRAPKGDKMFNTGELEGFDGKEVDDLDFIDKEEMERDNFMENLNQGYEPD